MRSILLFHVLMAFSVAQGHLTNLEERLSKLESLVHSMEQTFVSKYGLVPHCQVPRPEHGRVVCSSEQLKKGETCRVLCNSGYIITPGQGNATCLSDGNWNVQLQCEIPVVVLSGGQIREEGTTDSSVEILDLNSYKECKPIIPDMPLQNSSHRSYHNLLYDPVSLELLACNGLSEASLASCDAWKLRPSTTQWKFHSFPNRGMRLEMAMDSISAMGGSMLVHRAMLHPHVNKGRYAAESITLGNRPMILGGMINDKKEHKATFTSRAFIDRRNHSDSSFKDGWSSEKSRKRSERPCFLEKARAFFCSAKVDDYGVVYIGGFRNKTVLSDVSYSQCVNIKEIDDQEFLEWPPIKGKYYYMSMSNLPIPLSGHGCTTLPNSRDILVTGGLRFESDQTQSQSLVYSWSNNSWTKEWDMTEPRFGHKVFSVGDKVFAVGGKNKDSVLDSIEEYDTITRKWKKIPLKLKKPRVHFGLVLVPRSTLLQSCQN